LLLLFAHCVSHSADSMARARNAHTQVCNLQSSAPQPEQAL
jgi:hypothetical protein